jgi:predicted amidophosphoribosyltransferase
MSVNSSTAWLLAGALFVVLIATTRLLWVVLRRKPVQPQMRASAPLVCPTCRRGYPSGTQFCPVDAARLIPAYEGAATLPPGRGGKCPRCRRAFEVGVRFCPMDAEELVPMAQLAHHAEGASAAGGIQTEAFADYLVGGSGKICPVCASKYDLAAGYCGRDASELVTVN